MSPPKIHIGTLHYVEKTIYKAQKSLIAANFNGLDIKAKRFDEQKDAGKPDFVAKNPTGKVPFLETDMGVVFTSNAIARYVARCRTDTSLYGTSFDEEGQIDTWLEFCVHEIEVPLMTWVYPVMGIMEDNPQATNVAQADIKQSLAVLEGALQTSEFLLGGFVTLADIALVCALREGFSRVFDPTFRKPYPKVCKWFEHCCGLPQFKEVLGSVKLCSVAEQPAKVAAPAAPAAKEKPAVAAKKEEAPTKQKGTKAEPKASAKPTTAPAKAAEPKAAAPAKAAPMAATSGDAEAKIKAVGEEIRSKKEKLKGDGLSGKQINDHADIKELVEKLQALKAEAAATPAAAPATDAAATPAASAGGDVEAQVKALGDDIRGLKERLKGEGVTGKKLNEHAEVKQLVGQLSELKKKLPAQ